MHIDINFNIVILFIDSMLLQVFVDENHPSESVLRDLCVAPLTMRSIVSESSVIATSALDEDVTSTEVAEMPVQLDIEVEPVALDDDEIDHLRQDTRYCMCVSLAL